MKEYLLILLENLLGLGAMDTLIFDLDGTLAEAAYARVLFCQLAFAEAGIPIDGWRLRRRMVNGNTNVFFECEPFSARLK